jgi:RNA polymerase sigma factor (TIGR02999 family)
MDDPTAQNLTEPPDRAADSLLPQVYAELRAAAGRMMKSERSTHTLQPTALVHEAYAKLAKAGARFQDDLHFFNAAAQAMRRILLDHADARAAEKRGGGRDRARVELEGLNLAASATDEMDWPALNKALDELAKASPRQAQVVSLKFFAGLPDAQIASLLQISEPTVRRDWATARPWLHRQMSA